MKTLLTLLVFCSFTLAAQTVTVDVKLTDTTGTTKTYSVTLPPAVTAAMTQFVSDTKTDAGTPKYSNLADLLIRHVNESLAAPLLQRYPDAATRAAAAAAVAATKAAADAATAAAAPTVVVK